MSTLRVEGIKNAAASSDAITLAANGSAVANLSNYSRRNYIVNGGFQIHQRGNTTHSYSWAGDRFQNRTGSSTVIAQSTTVPAGFSNSMSLTASSGTLAFAWNTVLEAGNNLSGTSISNVFSNNSKWTVSIWSTRPVKVRVDFTDGYGPTNPQAIVAAYVNMTSTGETSNGFTRYKHTFDIGSVNPVGTSKGLHIGWSLVTAAADVKFTGAQLERGEYCGHYEHLTHGEYLRQCQRYYYRIKSLSSGDDFASGFNTSTTQCRPTIVFPVTMRTAVSGVDQSGTAGDYRVAHAATETACSAVPTFSGGSEYNARVVFTVSSGLTAGQGSAGRAYNSSAYLGFSAEFS